jgi:hypothetical protein
LAADLVPEKRLKTLTSHRLCGGFPWQNKLKHFTYETGYEIMKLGRTSSLKV